MENAKIVLVVNKKLEPGVALNAAAHLGVGLYGLASASHPEAASAVNFQNYADADGNNHGFVSALPLIVLRATGGEIRKCRRAFAEMGVPFVSYHNAMIGGTYVEQMERARKTPESDLEYFGVIAIGPKEQLDVVTRKLSLWK